MARGGSVTKSCHTQRGLLAQQTRVFVPGYVSEPGTFRAWLLHRPPSALPPVQGQRCNLLSRCQCIRSWRCTQRTASPEDRSSSGPRTVLFGKYASEPLGILADVLHVACQRVLCFTLLGASVFYSTKIHVSLIKWPRPGCSLDD